MKLVKLLQSISTQEICVVDGQLLDYHLLPSQGLSSDLTSCDGFRSNLMDSLTRG